MEKSLNTERLVLISGAAQLACESMGSGPGLVFLHAGVADRRSWREIQRALSSSFRCTSYDRRGYGESRWQPEAFSHVADLKALQEHLGGEPLILVGNSQGARIAIDFALEYPALVRALALVAPAYSGMQAPEEAPRATTKLLSMINQAEEAEDVELVNELEAHFWLDGPESSPGRVGSPMRDLFLAMNGRALSADPVGDEIEPASAAERIPELAMPVHLMLGGRDVSFITERGKWLAGEVARGSLTLFENAAHLPQLEEPEAFSADLLCFLSA